MGYTVKERGETLATFRYILVNLMETLAAWVPTTLEMEVKLVFGTYIWDVAQHADAFGKRVTELRLPLQFSLQPSDAYLEVLKELTSAEATNHRVTGICDVMIPALERRYRHYLETTDQLMDAPTVRILERCLADLARMTREGKTLREQITLTVDEAWVEQLAAKEAAIVDFVVPRRREKTLQEA